MVIEPRCVGAPAEQVAVPATVAVAIDVGVTEVIVTVVLEVLVRLLEGKRARAVEGAGVTAVGLIAAGRVTAQRRREALGRRADAEARGRAVSDRAVIAAGGRGEQPEGRERGANGAHDPRHTHRSLKAKPSLSRSDRPSGSDWPVGRPPYYAATIGGGGGARGLTARSLLTAHSSNPWRRISS